MTRYELAARLFHPAGGSWFVRTVAGMYLYLHVDLTTRDVSRVKALQRLIPESAVVRNRLRGYTSWRLTRQPVTHAFLKALLPMLPAVEQLRLADALGRCTRPRRSRYASCGTLLRRLRQRTGFTQVELAQRIPCLVQTLIHAEQGRTMLSAALAAKVERVLHAPGLSGFLSFWRKYRCGNIAPAHKAS